MAIEKIPEKAVMQFQLSKEMGNYTIRNLNPFADLDRFEMMAKGINAFQDANIKDLRIKIEYELKNT